MDDAHPVSPVGAILVVMRFEDLPADWAQRPVTDPAVLEGVVDLIVGDRARREGATYALLCHPNGRLLQPIRLPQNVPRAPCSRADDDDVTEALAELAAHDVHDVVLVIARPGDSEPSAADLARRDALVRACCVTGFRLHAVALAAPGAVTVLSRDEGAAAA